VRVGLLSSSVNPVQLLRCERFELRGGEGELLGGQYEPGNVWEDMGCFTSRGMSGLWLHLAFVGGQADSGEELSWKDLTTAARPLP